MNVKISDRWDSVLKEFPPEKKDIYYTEGYVRLYEDNENTALCIVCRENENVMLMPFLRKYIHGFYDFETAYGYGGPIANTENREWMDKALAEIISCFKREKYICGFIRFHPLLGNGIYCQNAVEVIPDRYTVTMDLSMEEEEIWKVQISSKNRNMIRKAEKLGLEYSAEYDFESIKEFAILYNGTMDRLGADSFYYFDERYYQEFIREISGQGFLGTVRLNGKLLGAALFMYNGPYGHYHLAGSNRAYSGYGINNFLLWSTARELKKKHVEQFHLGGGTGASKDDSLFKFKRSFSRIEKEFQIGRCIFNAKVYDEVCKKWEEEHAGLITVYGNRLLKYRYKEADYG